MLYFSIIESVLFPTTSETNYETKLTRITRKTGKQSKKFLQVGYGWVAAGRHCLGILFTHPGMDAASPHPGDSGLVLRFLFDGYVLPWKVNPANR